MKDSEFIELLNLYLDHEISAPDAARLEAEVQNNPARRKVYQQYCRMQKGCKLLATDFAAELDSVQTADARHKKVLAFDAAALEVANARRARMGNFYTVGTFAAVAACVAIIFVGRNRQATADEGLLAAQQLAPVKAQVVDAPAAIASTVVTHATTLQTEEMRPVAVASATVPSGSRPLGAPAVHPFGTLVTDPLLLTGHTQADAFRAAAMQQANAQLAWIPNVQLSPIQQPAPLNDLRFESTPATLRPEGRALGNRATANANVELAAFQFVK